MQRIWASQHSFSVLWHSDVTYLRLSVILSLLFSPACAFLFASSWITCCPSLAAFIIHAAGLLKKGVSPGPRVLQVSADPLDFTVDEVDAYMF